MIDIKYNKDENLIYVKRTQEIVLQDMLLYIKYIDENFSDSESLYIIDDSIGSISSFNEDDYHIIINEIERRISKYKMVRHAIIVDNPSDTVLTILFQEASKVIEAYSCSVFSTTQAAKRWVRWNN